MSEGDNQLHDRALARLRKRRQYVTPELSARGAELHPLPRFVSGYDWSSNRWSTWTESSWEVDAINVRYFLQPPLFLEVVFIPVFPLISSLRDDSNNEPVIFFSVILLVNCVQYTGPDTCTRTRTYLIATVLPRTYMYSICTALQFQYSSTVLHVLIRSRNVRMIKSENLTNAFFKKFSL